MKKAKTIEAVYVIKATNAATKITSGNSHEYYYEHHTLQGRVIGEYINCGNISKEFTKLRMKGKRHAIRVRGGNWTTVNEVEYINAVRRWHK